MRSIVAVFIAAVGYGVVALAEPSTAAADECPTGFYWSKAHATCVERPDYNPAGAVALCGDGKYSHSESRSGTCSSNGGVSQWCPCNGTAAPQAQTSDADRVFLSLASQIPGITLTDPAGAIASSRVMCTDLQTGKESPTDAAAKTANNTGLTPEHAAALVNAAITAYCPQLLH